MNGSFAVPFQLKKFRSSVVVMSDTYIKGMHEFSCTDIEATRCVPTASGIPTVYLSSIEIPTGGFRGQPGPKWPHPKAESGLFVFPKNERLGTTHKLVTEIRNVMQKCIRIVVFMAKNQKFS